MRKLWAGLAALAAACASGGGARQMDAPANAGMAPAVAGTGVPDGGGYAYPEPDSSAALHLLNRLSFGPRPGDVARVQHLGIAAWFDEQLHPERIADTIELGVRSAHAVAFLPPVELLRRYPPPNLQQRAAADSALIGRQQRGYRELGGHVVMATLARHVASERQLLEVMTDFWFNHFNVFMGKQADRWLTADYVERVIRPNALGRFEDLLRAVARHPAMLVYLDNAQSVAPGSRPPLRRQQPTGINENYARELLELHTLGVDGGYTQQDVQEVARILTGWSATGPNALGQGRRPLEFEYHPWAHDSGRKTVLGQEFAAGHGMDEGLALLNLLATHPSTARHIAHKLCARFVADDPPDGCVDHAVAAYARSGGDVRAVLRAIVASDDFWAPQARRAKVKTPLEFVVSALRAVNAAPDTTPRLAFLLQQLGQPLFMQQVPTGYPETSEDWVNSGALLARMNAAMGLAAGRMPGTWADLDAVVPATADREALLARVNAVVLGGQASANTLRVLREQLADLREPRMARAMAVGLALGSPEFQKQ